MDKMDIVKNGSKILTKIFDDFGVDEITDLRLLDKFLGRLLSDTKGLVILDFMDAGNWDCFGSYSIDYDNEYLFINWHYYTGKNDLETFIVGMAYKPSISTLMLHFKDLKIVRLENFPFVTLRGFALKEKETLKYFKSIDANTKYFKEDKANFYNLFQVDHGNYIEDCFCHDTPIYSILIIPKDTASDAGLSMKMLFHYNYDNCKQRIGKIERSIATQQLDEDGFCEKANSIRRIFEFVLKIECCYHRQLNYEVMFSDDIDTRDFIFKNSYSDIVLGDLVNILKKVKSDYEIKILNKIIRLSNELSHDSGKRVTKEKVLDLLSTTMNYTDYLIKLIFI